MPSKAMKDVAPLVKRRMGLIIGSSATLYPAFLEDLNKRLVQFGAKPGATFIDTVDAHIGGGADEKAVREKIREFTSQQKPSAQLRAIAEARWSSVLSFSLDRHLEVALQEHANRKPADPQISVIDDLTQLPPPRSVPVYKLIGSAQRDDFTCTRAGYIARKSRWRSVLRAFADRTKDAPVLALGLAESDWLFLDLVVDILGDPVALPRALLFLESDPLARSGTLAKLLGESRIVVVKGTAGELIRTGYEARAPRPRAPAQPLSTGDARFEDLRDEQDIAQIVNLSVTSDIPAAEQQRLRALLFAPSVPSWDPLVHNLDFRRNVTDDVLLECKEALAQNTGDASIVVVGASSSGKTIILKRAALELARTGVAVLWLKPWIHSDGRRVLSDLLKGVARHLKKDEKRVVFFADDPATLGTISVADALGAAENAGLDAVVVAAIRTSDWESRDTAARSQLVGPIAPREELVVPSAFSEEELSRLPAYLTSLGAASSAEDATRMLSEAASKHASDILATLYFLLPETRSVITESVREEYFRLGDIAGLTKVLLGQSEHTSEMIQKAYRMVAVAERFHYPLPIEVLVSALNVSYSDWLSTHGSTGSAYGLIYSASNAADPEDEKSETVVYRTRSSVVTDIIVKTVNGGTLSHAGEVDVLRTLLASCTGSQPAYREFAVGILVKLDSHEWLTFEEGLSLFDTAIAAFPFEDRTLVHHKAIWIRKRGNDPLQAIAVLNQALRTNNFPNASKLEADEHIYNSLARTTLDAMDKLRMDFDRGKLLVLNYLSKARSETFFNPGAAHVQASFVMRLLDKADRSAAVDYFTLLNGALADIDRALLLLHARRAFRPEADQEHRKRLETAKMDLLKRARLNDDLVAEADALWDKHRSQEGFVYVARNYYERARSEETGTGFKRALDYCVEKIRTVEAASAAPVVSLLEVAVHIYYHWRLQRSLQGDSSTAIDWEFLRGYATRILAHPRSHRDPLYMYIAGLALAHLHKWPEAHALFTAIRRMPIPNTMLYAGRDALRDANGNPHVVQGVIRSNEFLWSDELGTDVRLDIKSPWPEAGSIAHARIEFAFAGPRAIRARSA